MKHLNKLLRRFWPVSGYIVVLIGFMALMTLSARLIPDNNKLFWVQFVITLFAIAAAALLSESIRGEVTRFLKRIAQALEPRQQRALEMIPVPVAVIGYKGELVWYNNRFQTELLQGKDSLGMTVNKLQKDFDLGAVHAARSFQTSWGERVFNCCPVPLEGEDMGKYVLYFNDITELKATESKYNASRPTVMIVVFDNEDELFKARESERQRVISEVDALINKWLSGISGICWANARDKSLIVIEENAAKKLIEDRFDILEQAKQIVVEDGTPVTLSIGVGRGGADIGECEEWALQALDMALGRGGDQAVVKSADNFKFYGGVSNSSERQSKVKMRMLAVALSEQIAKCDNCIIMGHKNADLDAIGSAIGVSAIAALHDKETLIAVERSTSLAIPLMDYYSKATGKNPFIDPTDALDHMREGTLLVVVDNHSADVVENKVLLERAKNVVVIDHHRLVVNHINNSRVFIHETYASSASEIVSELAEHLGEYLIGRYEADALLAGIMLDTKNFVLRTGVRTFEASAFLRRRGADTVEIRRFFAGSKEEYELKSNIVSNAEIYKNCAIAVTEDDHPSIKLASALAADDMLEITGVLASFVVYPNAGAISISARSLGKINVQVIMEKLGGGGHLTMAGATLQGVDFETALEKLNEAIDKCVR